MRIALLAESDWLRHEATLFRHMVFGLTDEQVRITPIMPAGMMRDDLELISNRIDYRPTPWAVSMRLRLRRLVGQLREQNVNLLHVMDTDLLGPAAAVARLLDVPLVCSCWGVRACRTAAGSRGPARRATYIVPTRPMLELLDPERDAPHAVHIRPGVMRVDHAPPPLAQTDDRLGCVVLCDGRLDEPMRNFFAGVRQVSQAMPHLQLFVYPVARDPHRLWAHIRSLGLLHMVNLVGPDPGTQRLLVQCDAIIRPHPSDRLRTLLHQAMGAARPVLTVPDPVQGDLLDPDHARIVQDDSPDGWASQLQALGREADDLRALGEAAREYVKAHHGVGAYVANLIELYHQVTGEPLAHIGAA